MVSGEWITGTIRWDGLADLLVITTDSGQTKYARTDEVRQAVKLDV